MITKNYICPEVDVFNFAAEAGFQVSTVSEDSTSKFSFNDSDDDTGTWN